MCDTSGASDQRRGNDIERMAHRTSTSRSGARREAGAKRTKAAARQATQRADEDAWFHSPEGATSHRRSMRDVHTGRLQPFDVDGHASQLALWCTDEFLRRLAKLSERKQAAFAAALHQLLSELPASGGPAQLRCSPELHVHHVRAGGDDTPVLSLTWAQGWFDGRATFLLDSSSIGRGPTTVTLLSVGPTRSSQGRRTNV